MTSTHRSTAHGRRQAEVDGTKGIWNWAEDDLLVDVKAAGGAVAGSCANIGRRTCGRAVSKAPRVPDVSFGVRNDPERSTHLMGDWANGADTPTSSEAVAGRLALCGRGVGRIIDQPINASTVLCLHPLASTCIHLHPPSSGRAGRSRELSSKNPCTTLLEAGAMLKRRYACALVGLFNV